MNRIIIFGATSAIAQAAARRWAARDAHMYLIGRNPQKLAALAQDLSVRCGFAARIHSELADLDLVDAHAALLARAAAALGGVDSVLIAHGSLPDQAVCEKDAGAALAAIHTNAISVVSLLTHTACLMQARRTGSIAVITSVAGDRGRQSNYVYGAAKGMVSLFLQGMRNRLFRDGVAVIDIRPGFVSTPMTEHLPREGPLWASADQVAAGIVAVMDRRANVAYLPWFWRYIMLIIRSIPEAIFKRLRL